MELTASSLTASALKLYESFSGILEYDLGYSPEIALKVFASDLYTSSPTIFVDNDVAKGEVCPFIMSLVEQCEASELRKIARVDWQSETATISERLAAGAALAENGAGIAIDEAIEIASSASTSLIVAINTENITPTLIKKLASGDLDYSQDEILDVLEGIVENGNAAHICKFIKSGTLSTREDLEDFAENDSSYSASNRMRC